MKDLGKIVFIMVMAFTMTHIMHILDDALLQSWSIGNYVLIKKTGHWGMRHTISLTAGALITVLYYVIFHRTPNEEDTNEADNVTQI